MIAAILDLIRLYLTPLPRDAEEWETQSRWLAEQRAEDRVWAYLRGELPR